MATTSIPTPSGRALDEALTQQARADLADMRRAARSLVESGVAPTEALLRDLLRREAAR